VSVARSRPKPPRPSAPIRSPVACPAEYAENWHLKSWLSGTRQVDGATHTRFYEDHPQPTDPCGVRHTESGQELITMRRPKTNINLAFHPNGAVAPATSTVPARLRRTAAATNDYRQLDPQR